VSDARDLLSSGPNLSVGMVTADLLHLGDELAAVAGAGVELVHVEVMDGVFCPQITVGTPVVRAIPESFVKDVHLMIDAPLEKVGDYVAAGADIVTFHVESTRHAHRVLQSLAASGVVRGVALNPGTPLAAVEPLLDELELLLVLAVNPGWSGQTFIPATERKLADARAMIGGREIALAVDGGITKQNVEHVVSLGVDVVVAGSAVFDGVAPADNARRMLDAVRGAEDKQPALTAGVNPRRTNG
jgi:ribulose-phosphate 3-epimerase